MQDLLLPTAELVFLELLMEVTEGQRISKRLAFEPRGGRSLNCKGSLNVLSFGLNKVNKIGLQISLCNLSSPVSSTSKDKGS